MSGIALFQFYKNIISNSVSKDYQDLISVDPPKEQSFGDFSTNIAMIIAKREKKNPIEIAQNIVNAIQNNDNFEKIEIKKPGFINWFVPKNILIKHLTNICDKDYGKIDLGKGKSVNIEYVSANPTGPLHAGHARGAVSGDVLARLLKFVGYNVTKEFYINDAGKQIEILAKSLRYRYLELFNKAEGKIPDWAYPGDYLIETAKKIVNIYNDKFVSSSESDTEEFFKIFAINDMMESIKKDLADLGVHHDVFTSERELVMAHAVDNVLDTLQKKGYIYKGVLEKPKGTDISDWEEREQLLFKSTAFGDDVDRPLQKSDGTWTYFATDIAYHLNKINRGFEEMIDFWGADHGGYVKRMKAAVLAVSDNTKKLDVKLVQLVKLMENGNEVKMSKRAGKFVTTRDIIDKVGKDVIRFIMLTRKDDAPLDFDFKKVVDQSRDNPVFYVQYAYARSHSVINQFNKTFENVSMSLSDVNLDSLEDEYLPLLKTLADWPRQVMMSSISREPHRIAYFLTTVASAFHSLWNSGKENTILRFIIADDLNKTKSRIALIKAMQNVMELAFNIIGITPVTELR